MSQSSAPSPSSSPTKVILFPEGHGFIFISVLAITGLSKVVIVRSLKDSKLYVRKESVPEPVKRSKTIQSEDIVSNRYLGTIDGVPRLIGWTEYHDEQNSNNFVAITYWELYNGGTLDDLSQRLQNTSQSLPEACLWSRYSQMLEIKVNTIRKGILHVDAHAGNWYIRTDNGITPEIGLGDWGLVQIKPTLHAPGCMINYCTTDCPIRKWWIDCSDNLILCVIDHVHGLATIAYDTPDLATRLPYLALLLDAIENNTPSKFRTGEAWFAMIERLSAWITQVSRESRANNQQCAVIAGTTDNFHHYHHGNNFQNLHLRPLLPFDAAMAQIKALDNDRAEFGQSPRFWRVAYIDQRTKKIIAIEDKHGRNGYVDHTDPTGLFSDWLDDHMRMRQMVEALEGQMEQSENQAEYERPESGFEAFY